MNEKTLLSTHAAMARANPLGFILSCLLGPLGVGLIILLIWWVRALALKLVITDQRVILSRGILTTTSSEVRLVDIRNIQVKQSLFQKIFDTGTISISSAGQDGFEIIASDMESPKKIKALIDANR